VPADCAISDLDSLCLTVCRHEPPAEPEGHPATRLAGWESAGARIAAIWGGGGVRAACPVLRPPPPRAVAEELVARPGSGFQVRSAERQTMWPPTGIFNFVRVHGDTPRSRPLLVSAKLAHAQMTGGRPVVYAGTARFERGEMAWWTNFSGTYQPIAAFRAQAGLPEDKFVPWQKLQMGGTAMQRGVFTERRPARPAATAAASDDGVGSGVATRPGIAGKEPKAEMAGGRGSGAAGAGRAATSGSRGSGS
jgi:hypothetical protein